MKPGSIISLIIAAVLVLGGIITCAVASSKAEKEGVMLFPEADEEGNLIYRMNLEQTTKITVNCVDADITVMGGAEQSVIEVVNFNANYYKLTQSNGALNFGQVDDFLSMFKFWDNGFSFKGMRYILRFGDDAAGDKRIIIRLSDNDDIKLVSLSSSSGNITVKDCSFGADYTLKCGDGEILAENIMNSSSINIAGESADVSAYNCQTGKLSISADVLTADLSELTALETVIEMESGSAGAEKLKSDKLTANANAGEVTISSYDCADGTVTTTSGRVNLSFESTDSLSANVATKTGKISVNGKFTDSFSKNSANPSSRITVQTSGGDVYITYTE